MKMKILAILSFAFFLFQGCITEIEFKGGTLDPKLVVNSINRVDSVFMVQVSSSLPIPGPDTIRFRFLPDAKVLLKTDGKEPEELSLDYNENLQYFNSGLPYYLGKTIIEPGKKYSIEVSCPGYQTVNAEMTSPQPVEVLQLDTAMILSGNELFGYNKRMKVTIRFADMQGEKNFYRINASGKTGIRYDNFIPKKEGQGDSLVSVVQVNYQPQINIVSDDPVFKQQQGVYDELLGSSSNNSYNLFTDELFDGKTYELTFFIDSYQIYQMEETDTSRQGFFRLDLELYSLSEEAYWYIKSAGESNHYMSFLMSEPVQVYTNIKNGMGVFGSCALYRKSFSKGRYPIEGVTYNESWGWSRYY